MEQTIEGLGKEIEVLKKMVYQMNERLEDSMLTEEEEEKVNKSLEELEEGESFSLEDIKKLHA